jgi:Mce-associated membrane protein
VQTDISVACDDDLNAELAEPDGGADRTPRRRIGWAAIFVFGVLPALAVILTAGAGAVKWQDGSARAAQIARVESMQAARDSTVAMLSYRSDTVDKQLKAATDLLTGSFRNSYTQLTNDVVIPSAKQKQISAVATVPAVASVSATARHAVALVFVDQTVIVGNAAPTDSTSSVRVTLEHIGGRWLVSGFDPI